MLVEDRKCCSFWTFGIQSESSLSFAISANWIGLNLNKDTQEKREMVEEEGRLKQFPKSWSGQARHTTRVEINSLPFPFQKVPFLFFDWDMKCIETYQNAMKMVCEEIAWSSNRMKCRKEDWKLARDELQCWRPICRAVEYPDPRRVDRDTSVSLRARSCRTEGTKEKEKPR